MLHPSYCSNTKHRAEVNSFGEVTSTLCYRAEAFDNQLFRDSTLGSELSSRRFLGHGLIAKWASKYLTRYYLLFGEQDQHAGEE